MLRTPSTNPHANPRTMSDLEKVSDSNFVDVSKMRSPPNPPIRPPSTGISEQVPAPKGENPIEENVKLSGEMDAPI